MNLLFTCVGRRKYLIDFFKVELAILDEGLIIGTDASDLAPALSSCDIKYIVPSVYDKNYITKLIEICIKHDVKAILSLSDLELPILADAKPLFEDIGVTVVVSEPAVIDICSDKWKTYQFALENNIPTPKTYINLDNIEKDLNEGSLKFPLIVKPRWGSASFGLFVVHDENMLNDKFHQCSNDIKTSHIAKFALDDDCVIVQEYISGKEYGIDIFNSIDAEFKGLVCKEKLSMRAGETEKSISVSHSKFFNYCEVIATSLNHIGNLDCDFLENENGLYLLEMNPRFGGGYPFSHYSGGNLAKATIQSLMGNNDIIEIKYIVNKTFAKCDEIVEVGELIMDKNLC